MSEGKKGVAGLLARRATVRLEGQRSEESRKHG